MHDEFLIAFKSLPAESQRLLNDHYEVQIRNGDIDVEDAHIRINSVNSEDGWKEIGRRQKVSTTRTVTPPPVRTFFDLCSKSSWNPPSPESSPETSAQSSVNQATKTASPSNPIGPSNSTFKTPTPAPSQMPSAISPRRKPSTPTLTARGVR